MYSQTFYPFHMWFHNMRRYAILLPTMATVFGACAGDDVVGPVDLSKTKIAFASLRENHWEIYVINVDGTGETLLTPNPFDGGIAPSWSPDGRQIVYSRGQFLGIMNADGSDNRRLSIHFEDSAPELKNPAWSPDGETIICEADDDILTFKVTDIEFDPLNKGRGHIYIGDWVNLTNSPAPEHSPAWSPDGSEIAFGRDYSIYTMNPDGTDQSLLLSGAYAGDLAWSPDNRMLGYSLSLFEGIEVWRTDVKPPRTQVLIRELGVISGPSWSPDGRRFVYATGEAYTPGTTRLMIYDFSKGILEQQQLTDNTYRDEAPAWSPVEVIP